MKKSIMFAVIMSMFAVGSFAAESSVVYTNGDFSAGLIGVDTLVEYDFLKSVKDSAGTEITARVGGSLTIMQYKRLGLYVGATAPTNDPRFVSVIGGPSIEFNDALKTVIVTALKVLPVKVDADTETYIGKAARLKLIGGYDIRNEGAVAGVGFGWAY